MHCLWCDRPFQPEITWRKMFGMQAFETMCHLCRRSLMYISGEICRICGRMLEWTPSKYVKGDRCLDCVRWENEDEMNQNRFFNRSLFVYNDGMQRFMNQFKFRGDAKLVEAIKTEWRQFFRTYYYHQLVVPIPLSKERMYERGFNQSYLLAQIVSDEVHDILIRPFHLEKQSKKTRKERMQMPKNWFALKQDCHVQGKKIILIDDIYTTGTTVRNAATVLYHHGASQVMSLTLARAI